MAVAGNAAAAASSTAMVRRIVFLPHIVEHPGSSNRSKMQIDRPPGKLPRMGRKGVRLLVIGLTVVLALAAPAAADIVDRSVAQNTGTAEPEIEVSGGDAHTIVVGKNDSGVAVSHDGGRTFTQIAIPNTGDATLTSVPGGRFWLTSLDGAVHLSADNGDNW